MEYIDYSEPYKDMGEAFIEIILQEKDSQHTLKKIEMWIGDFDSILDEIPLNEDGMYVGLAYHQNIDSPWKELSPVPWEMDDLRISLSQMLYVRSNLNQENLMPLCDDICDILGKAINGKNKVLVRYFY
ncbi:MAG TPA: hypothetical protein PLZ08_09895 [Bacillota bacterium]|jgi:hypothetical protein|nr:hypothetical protein [Bacillota bacterium]HOL10793.1 hypothetical protein [Bacillota bacterium]HPO98249.1 hypothetical protein [Bacillota bacterium]